MTARSRAEYVEMTRVGAGGMGEVYRARDRDSGRTVAIKFLTSAGPDELERFANEARIQAGLRHPSIAEFYEFSLVQGRPAIVMEHIDGIALNEQLEAGPLVWPEAVGLFTSIVDAVAYLHAAGIVHRDIKSPNLKINSRGQVKLLDFGIARDQASRDLTVDGGFIGTVEYLAPERLAGKPATFASDVWALGVLLYEMVTGRRPFTGNSMGETCLRIQTGAYMPASGRVAGIPPEVDAVIQGCLFVDPGRRFSGASALRHALGASTSEGVSVGVAAAPRRTIPRAYWFAGGAAIVTASLAAWLAFSPPDGRAPPHGRLGAGSCHPLPPGDAPGRYAVEGMAWVSIKTKDGPADVYEDGVELPIGQTNLVCSYPVTSTPRLTLKRAGCLESRLNDVDFSKTKTWPLAPAPMKCPGDARAPNP